MKQTSPKYPHLLRSGRAQGIPGEHPKFPLLPRQPLVDSFSLVRCSARSTQRALQKPKILPVAYLGLRLCSRPRGQSTVFLREGGERSDTPQRHTHKVGPFAGSDSVGAGCSVPEASRIDRGERRRGREVREREHDMPLGYGPRREEKQVGSFAVRP